MTLAPGDVILTGTPEGVVNVDVGDEVVVRDRGHRPAGQHASPATPSSAADGTARGRAHASRASDRRPSRSTAASYFETVNPATQDVLAEVARGGAAEIDAAVAAAKAAFPGLGRHAADRARALMRRLGDLIAAHVPALVARPRRATPAR